MERILLRVREACEVTGVSRSMMYSLLASGQIPSVRIGRAVRVPVDELRRWVDAQVENKTMGIGDKR